MGLAPQRKMAQTAWGPVLSGKVRGRWFLVCLFFLIATLPRGQEGSYDGEYRGDVYTISCNGGPCSSSGQVHFTIRGHAVQGTFTVPLPSSCFGGSGGMETFTASFQGTLQMEEGHLMIDLPIIQTSGRPVTWKIAGVIVDGDQHSINWWGSWGGDSPGMSGTWDAKAPKSHVSTDTTSKDTHKQTGSTGGPTPVTGLGSVGKLPGPDNLLQGVVGVVAPALLTTLLGLIGLGLTGHGTKIPVGPTGDWPSPVSSTGQKEAEDRSKKARDEADQYKKQWEDLRKSIDKSDPGYDEQKKKYDDYIKFKEDEAILAQSQADQIKADEARKAQETQVTPDDQQKQASLDQFKSDVDYHRGEVDAWKRKLAETTDPRTLDEIQRRILYHDHMASDGEDKIRALNEGDVVHHSPTALDGFDQRLQSEQGERMERDLEKCQRDLEEKQKAADGATGAYDPVTQNIMMTDVKNEMQKIIDAKLQEGYHVMNPNLFKKAWSWTGGQLVDRLTGTWNKAGQCGEFDEFGQDWSKPVLEKTFGSRVIVTDICVEGPHTNLIVKEVIPNHVATRVVLPNGDRCLSRDEAPAYSASAPWQAFSRAYAYPSRRERATSLTVVILSSPAQMP